MLFAVSGAEAVSKQWSPFCSEDFLSPQEVAKNEHPSSKVLCHHLRQIGQPAQSFLLLDGDTLTVFLLPVCVLMCPCSNQGLENALPQILQTQGKVCVRMCILRAPRLTYSLSQYLQLKDFLDWASQCSCLCLPSPEKVE